MWDFLMKFKTGTNELLSDVSMGCNFYTFRKKGLFHRNIDKPAVYEYGDVFYFKNGLSHRDIGPAVIKKNGMEYFFKKGQEYSVK